MPIFSANLSLLYADRAVSASASRPRPRMAFAASNISAPTTRPPEDVAAALKDNGLTQALFNLPAGDWAGGERGIGCLPDRVEEFREGVGTAIRYAEALGCTKVNCLAGIAPEGATRPSCRGRCWSKILQYAAPRLADAGIKLLLEPINLRDIPGFFVSDTDHAERILDAVGSDNLYLQYDFYHMQIMQGDLIPTYRASARTASPMSRSPTIPAATSRAPARSTMASFSANSTGSAMTAGSAANTSQGPAPARALAG